MTTEPNKLAASINHERSPVLLTAEGDMEAWMHGSSDEARALLRPTPAARMRIVQAGFEKRDLMRVEVPA